MRLVKYFAYLGNFDYCRLTIDLLKMPRRLLNAYMEALRKYPMRTTSIGTGRTIHTLHMSDITNRVNFRSINVRR